MLKFLLCCSGFRCTAARATPAECAHAHPLAPSLLELREQRRVGLRDDQFTRAFDFRKTLDQFEVPAREQEELIAIVSSTKQDIVATETHK